MKHAIVLVNLGAPDKLSDVRPFLRNLFSDPDILSMPGGAFLQRPMATLFAAMRAPISRKYYAAIGGGSPLHMYTVLQAKKLETLIRSHGNFNVFAAQRYWHPSISETAERIRREGFDTFTILPLFPQYSTTTTRSVIHEWRRCMPDMRNTTFIERFYNHAGFIRACTRKIQDKLAGFEKPPHILFSAHSIPETVVRAGDPYPQEINETVGLIMNELRIQSTGRFTQHSLSYQSRLGPIRWIGPDTYSAIAELGHQGIQEILVFPVSFVSEHLETLYELDIKLKSHAHKCGIHHFARADTVQDDTDFIDALKEAVMETVV